MSSILYQALNYGAKAISQIYFKHVYVIGKENIPKNGPIIICGNHSNQFIDPLMIMTNCPRQLSFCMAASSLSKPVIGQIGKMLNAIPVYRPDDGKYKGSGSIKFLSNSKVEGIDTKFLSESKKSPTGIGSIQVLNYSFQVISIDSDTTMTIKDNQDSYQDIGENDYQYYFIPKVDNSPMFNQAYDLLKNNKAICIFPEGTSHDRTTFIKLKAGVALMSLGAMTQFNMKSIKIITAGLSYFNRNEFRSDMIIEFSKPFEIPIEWAEMYKTDKRRSVELLLNEIESRMKSVTLLVPTFKEHQCLLLTRDIYIPQDVELTPSQYSELCKRFNKGYEKIYDEVEAKILKRKLLNYMGELRNSGIEDYEVKMINFSYNWFIRKVIISFFMFHLLLILHLPMVIILCPFLFFIKNKIERERLGAIAKNPNKIEAMDIVSSSRIGYFLVFLPVIYLMWVLFFGYLIRTYMSSYYNGLDYFSISGYASLLFPLYAYSTAFAFDKLIFYLATLKTRFLYFCYPKNIERLRNIRTVLLEELTKVVNMKINDIDSHYEENRILRIKGQKESDFIKKTSESRVIPELFKQEVNYIIDKYKSKI